MSDVFNEVDEELRRDQVNQVFRRFLPLIVSVMVLVVGGVASYQLWTWWDGQQKAQSAETYAEAGKLLDDGKWEQAQAAFEEFAATGPDGYAALSKMQAAAASVQAGKTAEAARLYTEAATAFDDPLFSDMATLKAVLVVSSDMSLADVDARLGPLAGAGRPFRALARELMASKAMEEGDLNRARDEYTLLSYSLDAPSGTQQRAQMALSLLGPAPKAAPTDEAAVTDPAPDTAPETQTDPETDAEIPADSEETDQ